jgi:DNA (cytosine-5)-methyltransferase 1
MVLADLAELGFDAAWGIVSAGDIGAPHERERLWIVARNPNQSNASRERIAGRQDTPPKERNTAKAFQTRNLWKRELGAVDVAARVSSYADALRILHGMADRVDRLEAIGNGQVPAVAALAWRTLGAEE